MPSVAVLIGAMLLSPLMMPIIGLGFGIATFDTDQKGIASRPARILRNLGEDRFVIDPADHPHRPPPSVAVLIGAMLLSPLMMPIIGLGFGIATFDTREIRRKA
jgi:uncharacterized membrane protein